ncbi:hypothetical protein BYT27DRAFT_7025531, partial [Phlegmacium glaucopus]
GGMHCEYIWSTCSWKNGPARHDCVFVERDPDEVLQFHTRCVHTFFIPFYF